MIILSYCSPIVKYQSDLVKYKLDYFTQVLRRK
jgi:hypothetical protein